MWELRSIKQKNLFSRYLVPHNTCFEMTHKRKLKLYMFSKEHCIPLNLLVKQFLIKQCLIFKRLILNASSNSFHWKKQDKYRMIFTVVIDFRREKVSDQKLKTNKMGQITRFQGLLVANIVKQAWTVSLIWHGKLGVSLPGLFPGPTWRTIF